MTSTHLVLLCALVCSFACGGDAIVDNDSSARSTERTSGDERGLGATTASNGMRTRGLFLSADEPESQQVLSSAFLEVQVLRGPGANARPVPPGVVMHSGDRFRLAVRTRERVHLYLMYVDPEGESHVLYPAEEGDPNEVAAGSRVMFPPDRAVELDDQHTGTEQLYIIGSRQPLADLDDDTFAGLMAARRGESLEAVAEPTPVEKAREARGSDEMRGASSFASQLVLRTRGLSVVRDDDGEESGNGPTITAAPDEEGVAVTVFPIEHR